jgi:hypothetical protein
MPYAIEQNTRAVVLQMTSTAEKFIWILSPNLNPNKKSVLILDTGCLLKLEAESGSSK